MTRPTRVVIALAFVANVAHAAGCSDVGSGGGGADEADGARIQLPGGGKDAGGSRADAGGKEDGGAVPTDGGADASVAADAGTDGGIVPDDGGGDSGLGADGGADAGDDTGGADAGTASDAGIDAGADAGPDLDKDGIPDSVEAQIAADYLPIISLHPQDGCPLGGILFRLRPHPQNPALIHIIYDHLYDKDCGLNGHNGDDEVFSVTVNPAKPPSSGVTYVKAISHQATICQKITECGTCNGAAACETADDNGVTRPLVYSSKDKHGSYVSLDGCNQWTCLDQCAAAPRTVVPLVNAGEPDAHLTEDLTDNGFITQANGWTSQELFHFNPWEAGKEFGTAGVVADDLVDPAFDTPACE